MKEYNRSTRYFKEILTKHPVHSEAILYLGLIYFECRMYDEAIKEYDRYLSIKPDDSVLNNLAITYLKLGDELNRVGRTDEAKDKYEKALKYFNSNSNDKTINSPAFNFNYSEALSQLLRFSEGLLTYYNSPRKFKRITICYNKCIALLNSYQYQDFFIMFG